METYLPNIIVVIREVGKSKPDYSLRFEAPAVPSVGDYISIHRSDTEGPYGEDMIVKQIWWRFETSETGTVASTTKTGTTNEIFVECEPAIGPYSSDQWRDSLAAYNSTGLVKEFDLDRLSIRQYAK